MPGGTVRHALFSVPAGRPFLPALADALVSGRLVSLPEGPLGLAAATVYLPTPGAARMFGVALAQRIGRPALLPRIVALGESHAAELDLAAGAFAESGTVLAPPIGVTERRLVLARLALAWAKKLDPALTGLSAETPFVVPASPADAVALAADLKGLMDALTVEGVDWDQVGGAVDAAHSHYYRLTLDFLRIAAEHWPGILGGRGVSDPATRGRALVLAEAERLVRERPDAPVIAAGSLGSVPATRALLAAVSGLPNGAVVLPGLDTALDAAGWAALADEDALGHPQALARRLLDRLGVDRAAVTILGGEASAREALFAEVLRPAATTERWAAIPAADRAALARRGTAGLAVVEAADEREEALCAALALREALAEPGRTAALVTPDRGLAARVVAELGRWGLTAEDAAGVPLTHTAAGQLARLAADVAASDAEPGRVLALLAHPWVTLGLDRAAVERGAAALEIGALRGPAPPAGFSGLARATGAEDTEDRRALRPRRRLTDADRALAADLVRRLHAAFADFLPPPDDASLDLAALTARHREAIEHLRAGPPETEAPADPSLAGLDALFDDLTLAAPEPIEGRFSDYPAFFAALAADRTVPRQPGLHPRLVVLGLVEARLVHADRMVLAGLDEGFWPPRAEGDAFLNRPMRARVGLDPPERRIGQAAHDFVQAASCADAVITRAGKRDGAPTVPSRFLQRLKAFSGEAAWGACLAAGDRYRALAGMLDRPPEDDPARRAIARPAPRPDPALFPQTLAVTEVETLILDPYALFARRILGLDPLDPVAMIPGPAERGTLVHGVLGALARAWPDAWPADAAARLLALGREAFAPIAEAHPDLHAEWWPRFERLSGELLGWEAARRPDLARVHAEVSGRWTLPGTGVTLTARADRVEVRRDGGLALIDFKTGRVPSNADVEAGFAPQLTLQAAMLGAGAFRDLPAGLPAFLHVAASGGRAGLKEHGPKLTDGERAALVADHVRRLAGLVARFRAGEAAYPSRPFPRRGRGGAYDHLARVGEWSLAEDEEGG